MVRACTPQSGTARHSGRRSERSWSAPSSRKQPSAASPDATAPWPTAGHQAAAAPPSRPQPPSRRRSAKNTQTSPIAFWKPPAIESPPTTAPRRPSHPTRPGRSATTCARSPAAKPKRSATSSWNAAWQRPKTRPRATRTKAARADERPSNRSSPRRGTTTGSWSTSSDAASISDTLAHEKIQNCHKKSREACKPRGYSERLLLTQPIEYHRQRTRLVPPLRGPGLRCVMLREPFGPPSVRHPPLGGEHALLHPAGMLVDGSDDLVERGPALRAPVSFPGLCSRVQDAGRARQAGHAGGQQDRQMPAVVDVGRQSEDGRYPQRRGCAADDPANRTVVHTLPLRANAAVGGGPSVAFTFPEVSRQWMNSKS